MTIKTEDLELFHYGVKGMKWGVRKQVTTSVSAFGTPHRTRLEAKYLRKGLSLEEAQKKASGRIRTEKILLTSGAVAATAAAAYGAKVGFDKRFKDVDIALGEKLTNINAFGDKQNFNRRLYVTTNNRDANKYRGLFAEALRKHEKNTTVYETTLMAKERIRAPSHKKASELYKNYLKANPTSADAIYNSSYSQFNKRLFQKDEHPFFEYAKKNGYNALLDSNDQFISGYNTKTPLILFNAKSQTSLAGQKVLSKQFTDNRYFKEAPKVVARQMAPTIGLGIAFIGGGKALDTSNKYSAASKYLRDHPQSDLSYAEAYSMLKYERKNGYNVDPQRKHKEQ